MALSLSSILKPTLMFEENKIEKEQVYILCKVAFDRDLHDRSSHRIEPHLSILLEIVRLAKLELCPVGPFLLSGVCVSDLPL